MNNTITTTLDGIDLTLSFKGSKSSKWGAERAQHHRLKVTRKGKSVFFDFWTSTAQPNIESENDVLTAFACVVTDALCGANSFHDFCWELGYSEDSIKDEKIYLSCVKTFKKMETLGLDENRLADIRNEDLADY